MEIKRVLQEKTWEGFLLSQEPSSPFLQSWAWGQFQDALGNAYHRLAVFEGREIIGGVQVVVGERRLGRFAYVPHGPLVSSGDREKILTLVLEHLKKVAAEERADYLRVEPVEVVEKDLFKKTLLRLGFRPAVSTSQAGGRTLLLDLHLPEEELLLKMRKNTRYLVRKGKKSGVVVEKTADPKRMEPFHLLMEETYQRQGFTPHSRAYLQKQFEILAPRGMAQLYLAKHEGRIMAAAIVATYGKTATYLHGASLRSPLPVSHFLQWEVIRDCKKEDLSIYDFWGITASTNPRHPWYGYTLFKKGFGGREISYLGGWDLPLSRRYLAVVAVDRLRRLARRY
jgi:lipid II:glycine glycyltransferase (peptidoglycan interpeptide bridge formation enzyme)